MITEYTTLQATRISLARRWMRQDCLRYFRLCDIVSQSFQAWNHGRHRGCENTDLEIREIWEGTSDNHLITGEVWELCGDDAGSD